jgi:hypothetical protein
MYIQVPTRHALGQAVGPFEGTFVGEIKGDEDTSTTITAVLTHRDSGVQGNIQLGSGLQLDFPGPTGWPDPCKLEPVDLREFKVTGNSDAANSRRAVVSAEVDEPTPGQWVKSMKIKITVAGDLSADGSTMSAKVTLKPSLCGAKTIVVPLKRKS